MTERKNDNIVQLRQAVKNIEDRPATNKEDSGAGFFDVLKDKMTARGISDDVISVLEENQSSLYLQYDPVNPNDQTILNNKVEHIAQLDESESDHEIVKKTALQIMKTKH